MILDFEQVKIVFGSVHIQHGIKYNKCYYCKEILNPVKIKVAQSLHYACFYCPCTMNKECSEEVENVEQVHFSLRLLCE